MRIFIDTANIDEIRKAKALGVLDGVTTNPSLIARTKIATGKKFQEIIGEICAECTIEGPEGMPDVYLPVSVEVLHTDAEGMIVEGRILALIAPNVVVKLPCTEAGLKACKVLSNENIATNLTLCFSPLQALLVAKAGATYVSPFVGRLDDVTEDGMSLVANIKMIYQNYGYQTKILVASVRNTLHILNAARIGADVATIPLAVINKMMAHDLTDKGIEIFLEDARKASNLAKD